jgi:membrane-bound metal-dependent hydrolase YbcI (DUF457 family)
MDTITHGIVGSLLAKGYFSERHGRVATFAATMGAMFSDVDVVREAISTDPLAVVRYHRGITHSWTGLPIFAVLLAWLTRWLARRFGLESPSWSVLTIIYGVAIASHILLDGMTSFGTRMFTPFSQNRVAWDFLFIIDFTFTAIALAPQASAWIYRDREKSARRASIAWVFFTVASFLVWEIARGAGFPFHLWIAAFASSIFVVLFFIPAFGAVGFRIRSAVWCQAGTYLLIAYVFACGVAHTAAMRRVQDFAARNHISAERLGALPLPPSLLDWGGVIRAPDGVYASRFDLRDSTEPQFSFTGDSPQTSYTARAVGLPEVRLYWNFARFPVVRTATEGDFHVVEFFDQRFMTRNQREGAPQPFTYRVVLDSEGQVVEEGWQSNGMLMKRIQKIGPRRSGGTP